MSSKFVSAYTGWVGRVTKLDVATFNGAPERVPTVSDLKPEAYQFGGLVKTVDCRSSIRGVAPVLGVTLIVTSRTLSDAKAVKTLSATLC